MATNKHSNSNHMEETGMTLVGFRHGTHIYNTGWFHNESPLVEAAMEGDDRFIILLIEE